jgi:HSP20 family molecular chaperone IbpA
MAIRKKQPMRDLVDSYFEGLERELERWRETFFEKPCWNLKEGTMEPLKDMEVTSTEVVVTMDLPLTVESSLQVKPLDEETLEISAKMKRIVHVREFGVTHHKGEFQRFHCHTRVPVPVKMDDMKIKFKKGLLEIHIPRKHKQ